MTSTNNTANVIDAMRSIQTESDRWRLAEALATQIPSGLRGFDEIVDEAQAAGVLGSLSKTTLRLYRDAAVRWPAAKRVANVSFSAHREAMVMETIDAAAKMLATLSANLGPDKVTVASVRKAIAVHNGKAPAAPKNAASEAAAKVTVNVLADLMAGGPLLIGAITAASPAGDLDNLTTGLNKVIAHVEKLRAKQAAAAKRAAAAKKPAPKATTTAPRKRAPRKPAGDLRDVG